MVKEKLTQKEKSFLRYMRKNPRGSFHLIGWESSENAIELERKGYLKRTDDFGYILLKRLKKSSRRSKNK